MLVSLLMEESFEGYGMYWAILEVLRDAPEYRYTSDPHVWRYVLHAEDGDKVARVLKNYGLFDRDSDGLLYSPWLTEQLTTYDDTKRKRQEAGKRGAASRWGAKVSDNGNAIAMPLSDNGNAIAYNPTIPNSTQGNEIQPNQIGEEGLKALCLNQGGKVEPELLEVLSSTAPEGHAPAYIAQVCLQYGMGENILNFLCERTNNAETTNPLYIKFCALVRRIQAEKYTLKYPANFFLSKLFS
jgi:hypothetical protein